MNNLRERVAQTPDQLSTFDHCVLYAGAVLGQKLDTLRAHLPSRGQATALGVAAVEAIAAPFVVGVETAGAQNPDASAAGLKTPHGLFFRKDQGAASYKAESPLFDLKKTNAGTATANAIFNPAREKITSTAPHIGKGPSGSVTLTRINRKDSFVNLQFTVKAPVGTEMSLAAARNHDGSEYIIPSKKQLHGLHLTKSKKFWTGTWTDPAKVKENIIGGDRVLSFDDTSAFTASLIVGFNKKK